MSTLLDEAGIRVPFAEDVDSNRETSAVFDIVNGSVLLQQEHRRARHVKPTDFPDRTGFECFVNHVHFSLDGTPESILSCLQRATRLKRDLARFKHRKFQIIVSIANLECTIRFHQIRPNENWLAEDLEGYASEAILVI